MRATVRYGKDGSSAVYAQARPQEIPPAEAHSEENGWERVHTVLQTGDTLPGRLDGRTPDVQGAPQPVHEENQGSRSETLSPHKDIRGSIRERKDRPSSLRPIVRTIRVRALVGSQRSRQARRPPTSPQSATQVRSGSVSHNPKAAINAGVWMSWTDGSRTDDGRVVAAAVCKHGNEWRTRSSYLGNGCIGVFDAELWVIRLGLGETIKKKKDCKSTE